MRYRYITIWKEAPFLRLIIPFCGGIITERYQQLPIEAWLSAMFALLLAWFILSCIPLHLRYYMRPAYGLLANVAIFVLGAGLAWMQDTSLSPQSFAREYKKNDVLHLSLQEPLSETNATYKTKATVYRLCRNDSCIKVKGGILLYFKKDSLCARLKDGNKLLVFAKANPITNLGNPGAFDYVSYAKLKGFTMQAFVATDEYFVLSDTKQVGLKLWLYDCRTAICAILKKYIPGQKESALAEALLVGYKEDVDKELLQVYSNTGVVHVIAISGLHLGILYVILKSLLALFRFLRKSKWLTSFLIIAFLWLFSLLTGGSPSVIRSAVMFTAILVGESFSRKISIYNCLAASAFILLCYKPYWIFDIGFQLSYSAVLGILVFNKALEQLMFVKNKLLDKLWQMVTVTLAAQILATPLSLFYFHQFPNYFLLANMVVVPLSSAILIGTIFLCLISFVPAVPVIAGNLISVSIRLMNGVVEYINNLPFSVTAGINFSLPQVLFLYGLLIFIFLYFSGKKKIFLFIAQVALLSIAVLNLQREIQIRKTSLLIVYNLKGRQVIQITSGRKSFISGQDAACIEDDCGLVISAANTRYGITSMEKIKLPHYIMGKAEVVYFITIREEMLSTPRGSVVIPSRQMTAYAEMLCQQLKPSLIVLDASHTGSSIQKWSAIASKFHINIHAVMSKGAFVKTLN